ncbi:growth-regulating factor 5-like [Typha angustifolia]|uniref:growth-regulating factor 5-like n=1 Tax=Typha angustifolia TaxID=59011 RepID=UPI003C2D6E4E
MSSSVVGEWRRPFTAAQWAELEQQALVFKYLMAGIPVPADLLVAIRSSFDAVQARYYHHPSLAYYSYYGKKMDPEPGRCRRTDGKKWRCSKDAHPGSRYCERHMRRGRNRSRKPVESQNLSQSQSPSSTVTALSPSGSGTSGSDSRSFPTMFLPTTAAGNSSQDLCLGMVGSSQLHVNPGSYSNKFGINTEVDEHNFFSEASRSARGLGMDSSTDSQWHLIPSHPSSLSLMKTRDSSSLQSTYPHLQPMQYLAQATINSVSELQHQHSFSSSDFASAEQAKHENPSPMSFFDEWPSTRDSWLDMEEERSKRTSFSTTQLSISTPMSSDFSTTSK